MGKLCDVIECDLWAARQRRCDFLQMTPCDAYVNCDEGTAGSVQWERVQEYKNKNIRKFCLFLFFQYGSYIFFEIAILKWISQLINTINLSVVWKE